MEYGDLDHFKLEYIINFNIKTLSPLSIRSGGSIIGPIDNPIIRIDYNGKSIPYIPGSSLKGIFRSEAEKIVRTIYGDDPSYVCDILNPNGDKGELKRKSDAEKSRSVYTPCLICRIFGGPTYSSHVYFYNAYPLNDNSFSIGTMRRVSISRITGSQMPGRLFDIEFINPGSIFKTKIIIKNIDILSNFIEEAKIFNSVFKQFTKGLVSLGGMRSSGYGNIDVRVENVNRISIKDKELIEEDVTNQYKNLLLSD